MNESENPNEYSQQDFTPVKVVSYFVAPVGFVLEWVVARPFHYITSSKYLGPVFNSEYNEETPAPIAELPPPDYLPSTEYPKQTLHEEELGQPAHASVPSAQHQPAAQSPGGGSGEQQPVLH